MVQVGEIKNKKLKIIRINPNIFYNDLNNKVQKLIQFAENY